MTWSIEILENPLFNLIAIITISVSWLGNLVWVIREAMR